MSQPFPPPSGPSRTPHGSPSWGPPEPGSPAQGGTSPYAGPPAYGGYPAYAGHTSMPTMAAPHKGFNPWLAALLGATGGALITAVFAGLLFLVSPNPKPWETAEEWAGDWSGVVRVETDGSVAGPTLADAVRGLGGGDFYVEVSCPTTPRIGADVTTVCRVSDGYDDYRVVVLFFDNLGTFETAEIYGAAAMQG